MYLLPLRDAEQLFNYPHTHVNHEQQHTHDVICTARAPIQHGNTFCDYLFVSLTSWTMRFIWRVGPHWISKKHDQHSPPWVARPLGASYQRVFNLHASLDWNVNTYEYSKPWLIHVNPLERWIDYRGKLSLQVNSTSHVSNHLEYFWAGTWSESVTGSPPTGAGRLCRLVGGEE